MLSSDQSLKLGSDIRYIKGIGEKKAKLFNKLNIFTIEDLILHKPRRWEDFSHVRQIVDLDTGPVVIKAKIVEVAGRYLGKRSLHLTEALVKDDTGYVRVIWFNQPYRVKALKPASWYYLSGKYDLQYKHLQLINPSVELTQEKSKFETQIVKGVYPATAGLKTAEIYKAIKYVANLIDNFPESLPPYMIGKGYLKPLHKTLKQLHFPKNINQAHEANQQLGLRNLISLSLSSQLLKLQIQTNAQALPIAKTQVNSVIKNLKFKLTNQQKDLVQAITKELNQTQHVLNRLIQGDVGTGKTIIALLIAYNLMVNDYQVALIVPTQILAEQHFKTAQEILGTKLDSEAITVVHSGIKSGVLSQTYNQIETGKAKLIIGTQAVFSTKIKFKKLALVIIDEQHRFGVAQRSNLLEKTSPKLANILTLSATPIPRSLALVLYADLDISILSQKPAKRLTTETTIIGLDSRANKLKPILQTASSSNLIYIVCPSIESQAEDSLLKVEHYISQLVPDLNYVTLHGRLKGLEKEEILRKFSQGEYHALISTSIIEAGIDIEDANHIIIMSPEQFGLAQLHQMRGRVGRQTNQGYCYLCPYSNQAPSERLRALLECSDGFKLSEIDLKLRGPGTLYGIKQTGNFEIAEFFTGGSLEVALASQLAQKFIENSDDLDEYPILKEQVIKYQQVTYLN